MVPELQPQETEASSRKRTELLPCALPGKRRNGKSTETELALFRVGELTQYDDEIFPDHYPLRRDAAFKLATLGLRDVHAAAWSGDGSAVC